MFYSIEKYTYTHRYIFLFTCMFTSIYALVYMHICGNMCLEVTGRHLHQLLFIFYFIGLEKFLSMNLEFINWLDCLSIKPQQSTCLGHQSVLGFLGVTGYIAFYMGAGNPNSVLQTCKARTLRTEQYPLLLQIYFPNTELGLQAKQ